jgi:hypothetical protein
MVCDIVDFCKRFVSDKCLKHAAQVFFCRALAAAMPGCNRPLEQRSSKRLESQCGQTPSPHPALPPPGGQGQYLSGILGARPGFVPGMSDRLCEALPGALRLGGHTWPSRGGCSAGQSLTYSHSGRLNQSTGDSYTRRSRHVEITHLHGLPSVPMPCGLI